MLMHAVRALLDFFYLAQYPIHSSESLNLLEKALEQFHDNKKIFKDLGIRKSWKIPKLHYVSHYVLLIKWLGTLDNFDTQYTERLHIDLAKDAYEATNHKDEFAQMTIWLERKEKIIKHDSFIRWRLTGQPMQPLVQKALSLPSSRIHIAKNPTHKQVLFSTIKQEYHAPFIEDALARYIVQFRNQLLSTHEVEQEVINLVLPFNSVAVYHRIKIWLGDEQNHRLLSDESDVIHARPARLDKYKKLVPGRFDIALINDGKGQYIGIQGKL